MNKNARKTLGALTLAGAMSLGAFALLKTSVVSTNTNIITTTDQDGNGDNKPTTPDGQDNTNAKMHLKLEETNTGMKKYNALPETKEAATKEGAPSYKFRVSAVGKLAQVVRLNINDVQAAAIANTKINTQKINVLIKEDGTDNVIFEDKLSVIETSGVKGFGKCFKMDGNTSKSFTMYSWIDETTTNDDLFGSDGADKKSIEFKLGAKGLQHEGIFTSADEASDETLKTKYEEYVAK